MHTFKTGYYESYNINPRDVCYVFIQYEEISTGFNVLKWSIFTPIFNIVTQISSVFILVKSRFKKQFKILICLNNKVRLG